MGNNAANVSTGKPMISGAVFSAPLGTTVPTDATTPLGSAFECLGHVSEDGLSNTNEMDVSEIKAWGGMIVYRSLNSLTDNFGLKLIESENVEVLKRVYGEDNVSVDAETDDITISIKADDPEERVWVFEIALRGGKKKRIVIHDIFPIIIFLLLIIHSFDLSHICRTPIHVTSITFMVSICFT